MTKDERDYLIHSYLYYKLDTSIISDSEFDMICKRLLAADTKHPLISETDLAAGTGYSIVGYPKDIMEEAEKLAKDASPVEITPDSVTEPFKFEYSGRRMETWLLLGAYIDYGYAKLRDRQDVLRVELQRRWSENIHKEEFLKYFEDHHCNPERFGLK